MDFETLRTYLLSKPGASEGSLPDEDVLGMIDDSYELVCQGLPRARQPQA